MPVRNNHRCIYTFYWVIVIVVTIYAFRGPTLSLVNADNHEADAYSTFLLSGGTNQLAPITEAQPTADPLLAFQASAETVQIGEVIQFTLTITNAGDGLLEKYSVTTLLPAGIDFLPGSNLSGNVIINTETRHINYAIYDLAPGQIEQFSFQGSVNAAASPVIVIYSTGGSDTIAQMTREETHISVLDADPDNSLASTGLEEELGWILRYNEPLVNTFSGAATYNYSISVPPGRNGLQPTLNLSYNSKRVDGITNWHSSEWVGLGWSIDVMDIVRTDIENSRVHLSPEYNPLIEYSNNFNL